MKKIVLILGVALGVLACNKTETNSKEFKTAYIDTAEIIEKYEKFKDEDAKFNVKSEELGRPLEAKGKQLQAEKESFQRNAQANGQAWAQQKYAELQQREQQILQERDQVLGKIQAEGSKLQDTLVQQVKKYIKDFGKKEKFDYIFTTSDDAPTVIYAKDSYNLTNKLLKQLNEEYKATQEKK